MLSLAMVDSEIGKHYYAKDNYYTLEQTIESSSWSGEGARQLGLTVKVKPDIFNTLLEGRIPGQGELIGHDNAAKKHRGGLDLTFSAPKSVSLAALVLGDNELVKAHQRAVDTALAVAENRYSHTRSGTKNAREINSSGNFIAAQFHHTVSRALDPQLHTHCVVINAIKRSDGKWRAHHTDAVYQNSKFLGLVYQNELAKAANKLGYQTQIQENGTFEIKGFSEKDLQTFSKRRQQILALGGGDQATNRELVLINRPKKQSVLNEQELKNFWQQELGPRFELEKEQSRAQIPSPTLDFDSSFNHATAHEVSFNKEKAESFLLQANLGQVNLNEMTQGFSQALRQKQLIPVKKSQYTTQAAIACEQNILAMMNNGKGRFVGTSQPIELPEGLSTGQKAAVSQSLQTKDQFIGWQGVAGAGKTYALSFTKKGLEEAGYRLSGYAPSAEAAKVLESETGIPSTTVASKLLEKNQEQQKPFWIVDEAGLLSASDCEKLMHQAKDNNARVLFIGDTRQLSAVGAGNPFKLMQQNGLQTAFLSESRRQKTTELKEAVKSLAAGKGELALDFLSSRSHFEADEHKRLRQIAKEYTGIDASTRQKTLVLAGRRDHRKAITSEIRKILQRQGELGDNSPIQIFRQKNLTAAEIRAGIGMKNDDFLVTAKGLLMPVSEASSQKRVLSKGNTILEAGKLEVAIGDKLVWTRNCRQTRFRNGQEFTLVGKDSEHIVIHDRKGNDHRLSTKQPLYLDHGYVSTVYASQGKTADHTLVFLDNAISKEGLYVAVSRSKLDVKLFARNKSEIENTMRLSREKVSALDLSPGGIKENYQNNGVKMKF